MIASVWSCLVVAWFTGGQALPPPRDGEIRALYWELRSESEVWVTLEPKSLDGKPAPPGMIVTFTYRFKGKQPENPPSAIDANAYAGLTWAPRVEFWLLLDGREKLDLVPRGAFTLSSGTVSDYLSATVPLALVKRLANAKRVTGSALGFDFEITASQRQAVRAFIERILSDDPLRAR